MLRQFRPEFSVQIGAGMRRILELLAGSVLALLPASARADTETTLTFTYPSFPANNGADDDGILNVASQTFQEGGMHVESFWRPNN
jgi:hypothetical protein